MTGGSSKWKIPTHVLASVTHQATSSCLRYLRFSQSFQVVYVWLGLSNITNTTRKLWAIGFCNRSIITLSDRFVCSKSWLYVGVRFAEWVASHFAYESFRLLSVHHRPRLEWIHLRPMSVRLLFLYVFNSVLLLQMRMGETTVICWTCDIECKSSWRQATDFLIWFFSSLPEIEIDSVNFLSITK